MNSKDLTPLYKQILQELRTKLKEGNWKTGEIFPSENELIEQYGVSSITVRRVILELVNDGWLQRRPGIGTFVIKDYVEPLERLSSFYEEITAKGCTPTSKIINLHEISLDANMIMAYPKLELFDSNSVFLIEKINLMDNVPIEYYKSFWPLELGRTLAKYDLRTRGTYDILQRDLGIVLDQAEQEIKAVMPNEQVVHGLEIASEVPVLCVERLTYTDQWQLIEFGITTFNPERYRCRIESRREGVHIDNKVVLTD